MSTERLHSRILNSRQKKKWKHSKCPSTGEWINNCDVFTQWNITKQQKEQIKGTIKRNKSPIYEATWTNLINSLSKRNQTRNGTCHLIPFV